MPTYGTFVADIRMSLLFEEYSFPVQFESGLLEHFDLFSPFKWRIMNRIMSKTLLKIVAYNNRSGHHFSKHGTLID